MQSSETIERDRLILTRYVNDSARLEIDNLHLEQVIEKEDLENLIEEKMPRIRHLEHRLFHWENSNEDIFDNISSETENDHQFGEETIQASSSILCYISEGSTSLVSTASILSILLIAIDQYFAVTHPLRYHAFIDKVKSVVLLATTWLLSLLFGLLGSFVQTETSVWNFCAKTRPQSNFQFAYNIFYSFTYLTFVILVPFLVICVIYGCIYCAAHKNSERMRKSNSGSSNTNLEAYIQIPLVDDNRLKVKVNSSDDVVRAANTEDLSSDIHKLPKVKSAPNFANLDKKLNTLQVTKFNEDGICSKVNHANSLRSNSSFINSLKTKISNASLFKYREETRAAKISILVIFMVLICYMPYGLTLIINTNLPSQKLQDISKYSHYLNCISLSLLVSANLLSPFLFAYRNRRIQRELRRLFGLLPRRGNRDDLSLQNSNRPRSCAYKHDRHKDIEFTLNEPFLARTTIPEVVVTCKVETEKKSILKRVCSKGKTWGSGKRCNFISVPECLSAECRCSFSSASTQVSSEEYSVCN